MINMNEMMKNIIKEKKGGDYNIELDNIINKIVDNTKIIKECIIYDEEGRIKEGKINFDRILKFVGDLTGYEVSCNEFRFNREIIIPTQFCVFADKLSNRMLKKYPGKKFVIYIILDEDIELRFHTYRESERLWLDENLNQYDTPILNLISFDVCS